MVEYMDVVDDNDTVVGKTTQEEIYAKKLTHRIVHVFVIHPDTNAVYFQKRAETKSFLPGYYCTSAGGHVKAGESYGHAAKRELHEELGLDVPVKHVHSLTFVADGHKRHIELFVAYATDGFDFKDGEVASGEFLPLDAAYSLIIRGEKIHPQLDVCFRWLHEHRGVI